jgi:hypothetical protein
MNVSEMQGLPEAVRFWGKFWCLASAEESEMEEVEKSTVSEPALSARIIREVA